MSWTALTTTLTLLVGTGAAFGGVSVFPYEILFAGALSVSGHDADAWSGSRFGRCGGPEATDPPIHWMVERVVSDDEATSPRTGDDRMSQPAVSEHAGPAGFVEATADPVRDEDRVGGGSSRRAVVPEPASALLMMAGLALGLRAWQRRG
jgi:hypothetical protein